MVLTNFLLSTKFELITFIKKIKIKKYEEEERKRKTKTKKHALIIRKRHAMPSYMKMINLILN